MKVIGFRLGVKFIYFYLISGFFYLGFRVIVIGRKVIILEEF